MIADLLRKIMVSLLAYLELGFNPQGKCVEEWEVFAVREMNKPPFVVQQLIKYGLLQEGLAQKYYLVRQEPAAVTGLRLVGFFLGFVLAVALTAQIMIPVPLRFFFTALLATFLGKTFGRIISG